MEKWRDDGAIHLSLLAGKVCRLGDLLALNEQELLFSTK
jgi:hypothetical protein